MEFEQIKELLTLFNEGKSTKLSLTKGTFSITLEKDQAVSSIASESFIPAHPSQPTPQVEQGRPSVDTSVSLSPPSAPQTPTSQEDSSLVQVKAPMMGTFYSSPSPDAQPFVKVGDIVKNDTTVCTVEAMKMFNENEADVDGVIERILVQNGDVVEFGQPLFLVRPHN